MIYRKNNTSYSDSYLESYLSSVRQLAKGQTTEINDAWRTLGYINASAYKGYGRLSDGEALYNSRIYVVKERAIRTLVTVSDNVTFRDGILYIRLSDGIQVSFHIPSDIGGNNSLAKDLSQAYLDEGAKWDGVQCSYEYTDIVKYNAARAEYLRKVQEDREAREYNRSVIHRAVQDFFRHHSTRRAYGLPGKKAEWQAVCDRAMKHKWVFVEGILNSYGITGYGENRRVAQLIEQRVKGSLKEYNFPDEYPAE